VLSDDQRATLTEMENQLGAHDPPLAIALDTMTPVRRPPGIRRLGRWLFLISAVCAPLVVVLIALITASTH